MKKEEPSLIRKAKYIESLWLGDDHFWPIFEGPSSVAIKRDEPDRMPDAPIFGDVGADKIRRNRKIQILHSESTCGVLIMAELCLE